MRILILTSSTGGGHDMRARSLRDWAAKEADLGISVTVHQTLEETHGLYRFGVEIYNRIQRHLPILHHLYFNYLEWASMFRDARRIFGKKRFIQVLQQVKPDIVVSVHASLNHGFFDLSRSILGKSKIRCVTYCGELFSAYGFSRHWVNPRADLFIGAVDETCHAAIQHGMSNQQAWTGGFLLHPSFWEPVWTEDEKRQYIIEKLKLDPDQFILVLGTGAVGANNHIPFLEALRKAKVHAQVVVLCGRSKTTLRAVRTWMRRHPYMKVKPMAYTSEMPKILRVASAIVARPGTGTTSEAILSECPIILNGLGGIMPQEWITTRFCKSHGLAETIHRPADLARILSHWIKHPEILKAVRERMKKVRPQKHPRQILEKLVELSR